MRQKPKLSILTLVAVLCLIIAPMTVMAGGYGPADGTGVGDQPQDGTGNGPGDCTAAIGNAAMILAGNGYGPGDGTGSDGDGPQDGTGNGPGEC
jgi:hypothetical protein